MYENYKFVPFFVTYNGNTPEEPGVYFIVNRRIGKFYVGSTNNLRTRKNRHINDLNNKNHYNVNVQKLYDYNPEDFLFYFETAVDQDAAREREQEVLSRFFSTNRLLNISLDAWSAHKGRKKTLEQCQAQSQRMLGHKPSDRTREKLRLANLGKKQSPERAAKSRIARLGKTNTSEHNDKISTTLYGVKKTEQAKANMRLAKVGWVQTREHIANATAARTGLKRNDDFKANQALAAMKPVSVEGMSTLEWKLPQRL